MKVMKILFAVLFTGSILILLFSGCATKEQALVEEEPQVEKEVEKEIEEEVKEEEVVVEEEAPDLMIEKKTEETMIAKELPKPVDSDSDGVTDDRDKCPGTPAGIKVDRNGCPVKPVKELPKPGDSDSDGVTDDKDKCPGTSAGVRVDRNGCPVVIGESASFEYIILFDLDSAQIRSEYYRDARQALDFMAQHPEAELVKVYIEGHADSTGPEVYNYKLSMRRAIEVEELLVDELGIDADIIELAAFGEKYPTASNETQRDRQKNRRAVIEFNLENVK
jgi:OOP family OmpA-OmpF porin